MFTITVRVCMMDLPKLSGINPSSFCTSLLKRFKIRPRFRRRKLCQNCLTYGVE